MVRRTRAPHRPRAHLGADRGVLLRTPPQLQGAPSGDKSRSRSIHRSTALLLTSSQEPSPLDGATAAEELSEPSPRRESSPDTTRMPPARAYTHSHQRIRSGEARQGGVVCLRPLKTIGGRWTDDHLLNAVPGTLLCCLPCTPEVRHQRQILATELRCDGVHLAHQRLQSGKTVPSYREASVLQGGQT